MTQRRHIMLGTAGHVDHGKSALVKLFTGCETDTLAEEKQRGLTIDLGFAPCRLADGRVVGVVDVPGHVDFIRNMVAGAHGIDVVLFVVAADDGVMPQTLEHLHILTLMGLRHGLVALTKIDLVDARRRAEVEEDLRRLLAGTFLARAPICPLSNVTGEGLDGFLDTLNAVVQECADRPCDGLFRMWVADVFPIRGAGTVVTGIPSGGRVRPGDELRLWPSGQNGRVRRLQVYGQDAPEGRAGECVALNIPEFEHAAVRRGMVLGEADMPEPVRMAEATVHLLEDMPAPVKDQVAVHLHVGTAAVAARVALLEGRELTPGGSQMVQLRLAEPLALVAGDRFVLRANVTAGGRSGLTTIGGGRILDTSNTRLRRRKPGLLERLAARSQALDDPIRWAEALLREQPGPLPAVELQRRCLRRSEEWPALERALLDSGRVVRTRSGELLHTAALEALADRLGAAVDAFHDRQPHAPGITREALRVEAGVSPEVFDLAADLLQRAGRLQFNGTVFARPGWRPQATDPGRVLSDRVAEAHRAAGWTPPAPEELARTLGVPAQRVAEVIEGLVASGTLVRLDARLVMHREAVAAGQRVALELFRRAPSFTTMQFRDALGVSRKFAVPLLDHLDRLRVTVRSGNVRTPGAEARRLLAAPPT